METCALLGAGAANTRTVYLLIAAGMDPKNIILVDRTGALYADREDLVADKDNDTFKYDLAQKTNPERKTGDLGEVIEGVDVLVTASAPIPGSVKKEWVTKMASDSIVFACANPLPEIWPWEHHQGRFDPASGAPRRSPPAARRRRHRSERRP